MLLALDCVIDSALAVNTDEIITNSENILNLIKYEIKIIGPILKIVIEIKQFPRKQKIRDWRPSSDIFSFEIIIYYHITS